MIRYKTLPELEKDYPVLADYLDSFLDDIDTSGCDSLAELFGGDVFIVENPVDMKELKGFRLGGEIVSVVDDPTVSVDVHEPVNNDWYAWCVITNNDGGDTYFYPHRLRAEIGNS